MQTRLELPLGYLDDSLSPETKELVQRHLEHCEICSAILDSTRNIVVLTADDRVFELPIGYSERLHARLAQEIEGHAENNSQGLRRLDGAWR